MRFYVRKGKFIFEIECDPKAPKVEKLGNLLRIEVPTSSMTEFEKRLLYFIFTYWEERFFERIEQILKGIGELKKILKTQK